ncbi:MAG: VanZ family protein [Deltaproteobacteria bacterium]|nr:VanZ family protein [Deltaproteobacteria bacterium]
MKLTKQGAWRLVLVYVAFVYVGLYFTPFISDYLKEREALGRFIDWIYVAAGLSLFLFLYFHWKIRVAEAYGMLLFLAIFFLAAFSRMEVSTDRLHFLEHGLVYVLVYTALHFSNSGIVLVGRAILLCALIALVDEGIQGLLPNRQADWHDVWTNIFSYYLAAGMVAVVENTKALLHEKRDNLFLATAIVAVVLWIKYAHVISRENFPLYFLLLILLLIPCFYLLRLKRTMYHWSLEACFYLFFLAFVGILAFSNSILGINPFHFFH